MTGERLVKSRQRVADHGEVFTPRWLVDDMLDLVKSETERIDSRFLEPAFMRKSGVSRDIRMPLSSALGDSGRTRDCPWRTQATILRRRPARSLLAYELPRQ